MQLGLLWILNSILLICLLRHHPHQMALVSKDLVVGINYQLDGLETHLGDASL